MSTTDEFTPISEAEFAAVLAEAIATLPEAQRSRYAAYERRDG